MLNAEQTDQLNAMLTEQGPHDVLEVMIDTMKRMATVGEVSGAAWGHDAIVLQRVLPKLWVGTPARDRVGSAKRRGGK